MHEKLAVISGPPTCSRSKLLSFMCLHRQWTRFQLRFGTSYEVLVFLCIQNHCLLSALHFRTCTTKTESWRLHPVWFSAACHLEKIFDVSLWLWRSAWLVSLNAVCSFHWDFALYRLLLDRSCWNVLSVNVPIPCCQFEFFFCVVYFL